jgi:flagellar biosynthetic protein FliR
MGEYLNHILPAGVLISLRIGMLMAFAPFFSDAGLPPQAKAAFTLVLTVVMLPVHYPAAIPATIGEWTQAASGELALGLLMALAMHFVFEAARLAGNMMGLQLGYSLVNIIDPQTAVDTPVMSVFTYTFAMLIFLRLNVHHVILRGLARSYDVVAPGKAVVTLSTASSLLHGAAGMWGAGVEIAAPLVAATLLMDILLSLMSKASPQLPVLPIGIAVKALVGFGVLWIGIGNWPRIFERYLGLAWHFGERLLVTLR